MGKGARNKIFFSKMQEERIIREYKNGKTLIEVGDIFGVSAKTIQRVLEELGVPRRKKGWQKKTYTFSNAEKQSIVDRYTSGESPQLISDDYACHRDTIAKRLDEWGIDLRTNQYRYNHNCFSGRGEKAMYWAGYLMGDGSVGRTGTNKHYWGIKLTSVDRSILVKFRKFVGASRKPIYDDKDKSTHTFHFCSEQAKRDLEFFGVLPNKSLTAKIPNDGVLYNRHFWRGLIDADGCISRNGRYPQVGLGSGSKRLIEQYLIFLKYHDLQGGGSILEVDTKNGFYLFNVSCERASELARLLYKNAKIFLARKMEKAQWAMNYYYPMGDYQ